jgi:hypothetical protein
MISDILDNCAELIDRVNDDLSSSQKIYRQLRDFRAVIEPSHHCR